MGRQQNYTYSNSPQYLYSFYVDGFKDLKALWHVFHQLMIWYPKQLTLAATAKLLINGVFWGFMLALQILYVRFMLTLEPYL